MKKNKKSFPNSKYTQQILDVILDFIENSNSDLVEEKHFKIIKNLSENINNSYIRKLIIVELSHFYENIVKIDVSSLRQSFIGNLLDTLTLVKTQINYPEHFNISNNSETYYENKINELRNREIELTKILNSNKNLTKEQKKITDETLEKLRIIEHELNTKKKELEVKQKQEDAKNDWEQKINTTFTQLKDYLTPIIQEYNRLNVLYYVFAGLSIATIIIISIIEINAIYKLASIIGFPNFEQYLMLFLPLPIAGALMWGFVFQMNRAQRQLISIANNIHNTNYIQGLLISINNLSPNLNDGILRINNALDKIIHNHLENKAITSETDLIREENKDKSNNIDIDKLVKLIKTVKDTVK